MMAGLEGGDSQAMAPLKPHAQAHLLSPTDKCKVCTTFSFQKKYPGKIYLVCNGF